MSLYLTEENNAVLQVDIMGVVGITMEAGDLRQAYGNIPLENASSFYNKHHIGFSSVSHEFTSTLTLGHCKHPNTEVRTDRVQRVAEFVGETTINRTCFFTRSGDFGLGPEDLHTGDVLVRIPGGRVLIALRRTPRRYIGEIREFQSGN